MEDTKLNWKDINIFCKALQSLIKDHNEAALSISIIESTPQDKAHPVKYGFINTGRLDRVITCFIGAFEALDKQLDASTRSFVWDTLIHEIESIKSGKEVSKNEKAESQQLPT